MNFQLRPGLFAALFIIVLVMSAVNTRAGCETCAEAAKKATGIKIELSPVERYVGEQINITAQIRDGPELSPARDIDLVITFYEGDELKAKQTLQTDDSGLAVFYPEYAGSYTLTSSSGQISFGVEERVIGCPIYEDCDDENETESNENETGSNENENGSNENETGNLNEAPQNTTSGQNKSMDEVPDTIDVAGVSNETGVEICFFWSKTCPHCKEEKPFLAEMEEKYAELKVNSYEIMSSSESVDLLFEECSKRNMPVTGSVPITFIGDKAFLGFTDENGTLTYHSGTGTYTGYANQIENAIRGLMGMRAEENHASGKSVFSTIQSNLAMYLIPCLAFFVLYWRFKRRLKKRYWVSAFFMLIIILLFLTSHSVSQGALFEEFKNLPFPVFTLLIAFFDGFNPCAMFVLCFLLAMLVYTDSRKKMALIGFVFIFTSGFMYLLYMLVLTGLLTTDIFSSNMDNIRLGVGLVAIIAGLINVKDFFFFKQGVSLTIPEGQKSGIYARVRGLINTAKRAESKRALLFLALATVVLAASVNLVELVCSAFLPLMYTSILTSNYGTEFTFKHLFYLVLYCAVYIIPLLAIFLNFLNTLKTRQFTEEQGRKLKLVSGILMLALGTAFILFPELLMFGA